MNIDVDIKKLLVEISDYQDFNDESQEDGEVNLDLFNILSTDEIEPGDRVEITWKNRDYTDFGYLFMLPNQDIDTEFDMCVHIPKPDNSEGMGDGPPAWLHLYELVKLEDIKEVKILKTKHKHYDN